MRSFAFAVVYWTLSILYTLAAVVAALLPGRGATGWIIRRYVRRMVQAMRGIAGIKIQYRGEERLPTGAFMQAVPSASRAQGSLHLPLSQKRSTSQSLKSPMSEHASPTALSPWTSAQ